MQITFNFTNIIIIILMGTINLGVSGKSNRTAFILSPRWRKICKIDWLNQ